MRVRRFLVLALFAGLTAAASAQWCPQTGRFLGPRFRPWPWRPALAPVAGVWSGFHHPFYGYNAAPVRPRPLSNQNRFDLLMAEGKGGLADSEWTMARHRFQEAWELATKKWGAGSNQAREAKRALDGVPRFRLPDAPAAPPLAAPGGVPEPATEVARAGGSAFGDPAAAGRTLIPVTPEEVAAAGVRRNREARSSLAATLEKIRARLKAGRGGS